MRQVAAVGVLLVLLSLAGCGGASKLPPGGWVAWQTGILDLQWCAQHGFQGTYSITGYTCRGSASSDTNNLLIATLNTWHPDGRLRASLLNDAANKLQSYCAACVAVIEAERGRDELSGSSSTASLIVWIYVLWCLVGGILGAVIARSKNRKTWHGALLGVLLGLIGVLIVALLPALPEAVPSQPSEDSTGAEALETPGEQLDPPVPTPPEAVPPQPSEESPGDEALETPGEHPDPPASSPPPDLDGSTDSRPDTRETEPSAAERDREARHKELTLGYIDELLAEEENDADAGPR